MPSLTSEEFSRGLGTVLEELQYSLRTVHLIGQLQLHCLTDSSYPSLRNCDAVGLVRLLRRTSDFAFLSLRRRQVVAFKSAASGRDSPHWHMHVPTSIKSQISALTRHRPYSDNPLLFGHPPMSRIASLPQIADEEEAAHSVSDYKSLNLPYERVTIVNHIQFLWLVKDAASSDQS
ncbi:hypothetical protein EXIGLDRAFT_199773 [Exidia glandulosa HHB12029]|uniref:Uncharacterized protein n=1 Tax=Exidia glandulosa HHB12029 TaxID=1314781 RepID=A0A165ESG3_EXIGL|nr:hypothetical protein EXIGLDRAFT_199773 [Exidia glandulosa HHB12029]